MKCIKERCVYFVKHNSTCKLNEDENGVFLYTSKRNNCVLDEGIIQFLNNNRSEPCVIWYECEGCGSIISAENRIISDGMHATTCHMCGETQEEISPMDIVRFETY